VIAGCVLGVEVALDRGHGVPHDIGLGEAIGARRRCAAGERGVSAGEHVDGEAPCVSHALPGERVARWAEGDEWRL
jgi:hypothetical protein